MNNAFPWFKAEEKKFYSAQPSKHQNGNKLSLEEVLALEAT